MSALTPEGLSYLVRHDTFQAVIVEALVFGVYTSLVLFTMNKLASQYGMAAFCRPLAILMLVMYICAIMHLASIWTWLKGAFVDQGASEMSIFAALSTRTSAETVTSILSRSLLMFIADCIMIWRCWILYSHAWSVVALPVMLVTAGLGVLFARLVYQVRERALVYYSEIVGQLTIAHISLTLAATVLVTVLLVYQIVRMGGFKRYRDVIAIIVESSALYACALIIYMPFPFHPTFSDMIPNAVLIIVPGISSTLIIARVSLGRGIERTFDEKSTHTGIPAGRQVSIRHFQQSTADARDEESEIGAIASTTTTGCVA